MARKACSLLLIVLGACGQDSDNQNTVGTQESVYLAGNEEGSVALDLYGKSDRGQAIALQGGKVVVCGLTQTNAGSDSVVCRLNSDNQTLDPSFGINGTADIPAATMDDGVMAVQVDSQERIWVAGYADDDSGNRNVMVGRLNPNGGLDSTFGNGGFAKMQFGETTKDATMNKEIGVYGFVLDGNEVIVGGSAISGGKPTMFVARFKETGKLDASFGGSGIAWANFGSGSRSGAKTLALAGSGLVVAGGWVVTSSAATIGTEAAITVWEATSGQVKVQKSFDMGIGGWDDIYGVAVDGAKIICVGSGSNPGGANRHFASARLTFEGELDSSFGSGGRSLYLTDSTSRNEWKAVVVGPSGEYYAAGVSKVSTQESYINVACINSDGTLRSSFGPGGDGLLNISIGQRPSSGYGCQLQNGKLFLVGTVGQETSNPDIGVAVVN